MKTVKVLWWRYDDGSASGITRVYEDESRAEEDYELIQETQDSREWFLSDIPFIEMAKETE